MSSEAERQELIQRTVKGDQDALQQLYNFYASELLRGNKHIKWLARDISGKQVISHWQKLGIVETKEEEKALKKRLNKPAKTSFADMEVLQGVKEKLEKAEAAKKKNEKKKEKTDKQG